MSSIPLSELNLFTDLKFEKRNLIFLDSPFSFFEFAINYLSLQKFFSFNISIDGLTKPSFLQIATVEFIFILDLRKLKQILEKYKKIEWFCSQMDQLFQSQILKITFNLETSFNSLNVMFPGYFSFAANVLDIKDLYKVRNLDISTAPYYNNVLKFQKLASNNTQSQENLALYPYLILLIYMNITKENTLKQIQIDSNRCLSLFKDLQFLGSIAFINENNVNQMQNLLISLKNQSTIALDGVSCPKDQVMDLLLIATWDLIYIIDIKGIKKKIFINLRKSKGDTDSIKSEGAKTLFLNQLNEILQNENVLKISYDFSHDFRCLKNRFNKDIASLNNLLNIKNYNKMLNYQENATFNEIVYSLFKRQLPVEDLDNKQNFLHPLGIYNLATQVYSLLHVFKIKFNKTPYNIENYSLLNVTLSNKKENKGKNSPILQEYDVYYPNVSFTNVFGNYYDYPQTLMIPEFMNLQISPDFISLNDLNFDESRINLIDMLDETYELSIQKIKHSKIIGIDSEWHPNETVTAILQIATEEDIFIFDIYGFKKNLKKNLAKGNGNYDAYLLKFYEGINDILTSNDILKVSFDFNNDKINLSNSHQIFDNEYNKILDFVYYRSAILGQNKGGLKDLVLRVFNKTLCKSMVLSNWKQRPLSDEQIKYAALDALVVLQIYLKFKENLFFGV